MTKYLTIERMKFIHNDFTRKNLRSSLILIVALLFSSQTFAQHKVSGYVTDQDHNAVSGATINVGTLNIMTDSLGFFQADLAKGDKILISKPGFNSEKMTYTSGSELSLVLVPDSRDQEINVAFGKQKKDNVAAAISSISGSDLSKTQTQNLTTAINGQLNGLTVSASQSEPGSEFPALTVRGMGSYNNNNAPLVYVDGFEAPYENLMAAEIETINVFKDAAALAPFGIRGANGVVWATTKRGQAGKTRITLNTRTGFSKPITLPTFLDSYDYARLYNEAQSNDNGRVWSPEYSESDLTAYKNGSDPVFHPNINWYDETLKSQIPNYEANLTFSGGTKTVKYFIAMGYLNTPKLFKDNKDAVEKRLENTGAAQRYNFRSNVDITLNKVFDASINLGGSIQDRSFPNYDNFFGLLAATPPNVYAPINPDSSYGGNAIYRNNPVGALFGLGQRNTNARTLQTNFKLTEKLDMILPGLSLNQEVSFLTYFQGNYNYQRDYARFSPVKDPITNEITYDKLGNNTPYSINESEYNQYRRDNYAVSGNYQKDMGDNSLNAMLTYRYTKFITVGNTVPFTNAGVSGRVSYAHASKYLAEFNFAYNGSDNFAKGKRYGFFPAVSAGWILSKENFLKDKTWMNFLKLRSSIGLVGNDQIGGARFLYQGYYFSGPNYILGNNGNTGFGTLREGAIGNNDITWEKDLMFNVGIDSRILDDHLGISLDFFMNKRTDILATRAATAAGVLGVDLPYENLGKTSNKGVELSLNYNSTLNKPFTYYIAGNISYAKSKILSQEEVIRSQPYLYRTGKGVSQPFGLTAIGFYQSQEEIDNVTTPVSLFGPVQPGDIRYKDQNNDGFINEDDQTAIGYSDVPQISGSLTLGAQFKAFDIMGSFYGVANRSLYLNGTYFWAFYNNGQVPEAAKERWAYYPDQNIDTRATATYPRLTLSNSENNFRRSTFWTKNGNFLRLKNLEVGYTIPKNVISKAKIENIRLFISGTNLITFSKEGDYDPEFPSGYPLMKNYQFGFTVKF